MKSSRAPIHALIAVVHPTTSHRAFRSPSLPGIDVRLVLAADVLRDTTKSTPDVLVIEGSVPGFADLIAEVRTARRTVPILFVAEHLSDVAPAVAAGANDFVTRAASPSEVGIRIQLLVSAVVRPVAELRSIGPLTLARDTRLLSSGTRSVVLSPIEAKMFERLLLEPGRPVPRAELERSIWGQPDMSEKTNVAVVYVSYLRKKLARLGDACSIRTITNVGYALEIKRPNGRPTRLR